MLPGLQMHTGTCMLCETKKFPINASLHVTFERHILTLLRFEIGMFTKFIRLVEPPKIAQH